MEDVVAAIPKNYSQIVQKSEEIGFTMPSDQYVGSLLKTLVASKPAGNFLELGTGLGLSLSWISEGLDENSKIVSVDNDPELVSIAQSFFVQNNNISIVCANGAEWIAKYDGDKFDLIFADAWPGKFECLDKTLELLNPGGFYVIDDLDIQPNWPTGHQEKVDDLLDELEGRTDLILTKMNWSTGLVLATKK